MGGDGCGGGGDPLRDGVVLAVLSVGVGLRAGDSRPWMLICHGSHPPPPEAAAAAAALARPSVDPTIQAAYSTPWLLLLLF